VFSEVTVRLQDYEATIRRVTQKFARLADHVQGSRPQEVRPEKSTSSAGTVIGCLDEMHRAVIALEEPCDRFFQQI